MGFGWGGGWVAVRMKSLCPFGGQEIGVSANLGPCLGEMGGGTAVGQYEGGANDFKEWGSHALPCYNGSDAHAL